ncbi:MAG: hypothetical protein FD152_4614, partial [Xanthobacteraceae bacterium]
AACRRDPPPGDALSRAGLAPLDLVAAGP